MQLKRFHVSEIIVLFFSFCSLANGVEILDQQNLLQNFTEVWPSPMTSVLDFDQSVLEDQNIGNAHLTNGCLSSFQTSFVQATNDFIFNQTNTAATVEFNLKATFGLKSASDIFTLNTNLILKALSTATLSMQLKSDVPFTYEIAISNLLTSLEQSSFSVSFATVAGNPIFSFTLNSSDGSPLRTQGELPAGTYRVALGGRAQAEGEVYPTFENLFNGLAQTTCSLNITPVQNPTIIFPSLKISKLNQQQLILNFSNLEPGTHYFVERSEELVSEPWPIFANFIAAGTNTTLIENLNPSAKNFFYRLKF